MQIQTIGVKNKRYPALLAEISSPPPKIYTLGNLPEDKPAIAIVGSRKSSSYGREVTHRLAHELAGVGVCIISGLALGIDTVAHEAALEAGGMTIGVLACGLDRIYPASNRNLAKKMLARGGGLISEYPVKTEPYKSNFPARNRIIAGLSLGVLVTEAPAESGALITANFALEQNRLVMAVPGNITSQSSTGTNNLIKAGALAVSEARDVLNALDMETPALKAKIAKPASKDEAVILKLLAKQVSDGEELIAQSGFDTAKFNQVITLMEISGKVRNLGAGKWISR